MTDNLGPEIKIDGKRPDWLKDDEMIGIVWRDGTRWDNLNTPADCVFGWEGSVTAIMLRADHPYYVATSKGFAYWQGGENAPDDWDGGYVLFRNGEVLINASTTTWRWTHGTGCDAADIIGYRKRAEPTEDDGDYVRVKRMTLDEAGHNNFHIETLAALGLIKFETPIDQFERDHGGLDNNQRDIVNAFIEWQKGNS